MDIDKITTITPEKDSGAPFSDLKERFPDNDTVKKSIEIFNNLNLEEELEKTSISSNKIEILVLGEQLGVLDKEKICTTVSKVLEDEHKSSIESLNWCQSRFKEFKNRDDVVELVKEQELKVSAIESEILKCKDSEYAYKWFLSAKEAISKGKEKTHSETKNISKKMLRFFGEHIPIDKRDEVLQLYKDVIAVTDFEYGIFFKAQFGFWGVGSDGFNTSIGPEGNRAVVVPIKTSFKITKDENGLESYRFKVQPPESLTHELLHKICDVTALPRLDKEKNIIESNRGFNKYQFDPDTKERIKKYDNSGWLQHLDEGSVTVLEYLMIHKNTDDTLKNLKLLTALHASKEYKKAAIAVAKAVSKVGVEPFKEHYIENNVELFFRKIHKNLSEKEQEEFYQGVKEAHLLRLESYRELL